MKRLGSGFLVLCALALLSAAGAGLARSTSAEAQPALASFIGALLIDHTCTDISRIPDYWLTQAKNIIFHYARTSHGSQINSGLQKLEENDPKYGVNIHYGGLVAPPGGSGELRIVIQRGGLGAVADAYIWESEPDYTGNWAQLYTGMYDEGRKRTVIRFYIEMPQGVHIIRATLGVYQHDDGGSRTVNVHRITAPWQESGEESVTWRNFSGFDPAVVGSFLAGGVGWKLTDVTTLAQGWREGRYANYGLLLDDPITTPYESESYWSSEHETISLRPKLIICYDTLDRLFLPRLGH